MGVSVHPELWGEGHFIQVVAVVVAFTRLDEHGRLLKVLAVRTHKSHGHGACAPRRAAPAVCTHATVVRAVETDARTVPVGQMEGARGPLSRGAAFTFLWMKHGKGERSVSSSYTELTMFLFLQVHTLILYFHSVITKDLLTYHFQNKVTEFLCLEIN